MSVQIPNAVKWQWYGDKGWADYDKKVVDNMEEEFQEKKSKKIKVDKERYVDIDFKSGADIKKNFNGMEKEENLVGIQRRYDDEMKRRAVRRVTPDIFSSEIVIVCLPKKSKEPLERAITLYQGLVPAKLTKKVTAVVANEKYFDDFEDELNSAKEFDIPIVSSDFITDSIEAGKTVSRTKYILKVKKRKKEPEEEEEGPPKKKKADSDEETSSKAKYEMKEGSQWMGVCSYKLEKKHYPFSLSVKKVKSQGKDSFQIKGVVEWPTLNGASTKFKGEIDGKTFNFKEYEILKGKDEVEVPTNYKGKFADASTINGKVDLADLEGEEISFALNLVNKKSSSSDDQFSMLKEKAEFKGECYQTFPFNLTITSRKDESVTGTIKWPSFGNTKTKFKGKIENDNVLVFEEHDILEGDGVEVPVSYSGKLSKEKLLEGKFGPNVNKNQVTGTFKLFLDK
eukprot:TRINITY_DN2957_c0_g5_i2.p1 TRINITY_DN2957_c0_g5~~TRINITY_DN2957_c0_g5_i2.p1  ORF type:complete len:488 (+),score=180.22 TRINITY_DN2957_c0_g5_i2:103-1464(+)